VVVVGGGEINKTLKMVSEERDEVLMRVFIRVSRKLIISQDELSSPVSVSPL
jgi:hypothetical protein